MNKKLKTLLVSLAVLALVGVSAACFAILPKANMKPSDYDLGVTYAQASQEDKPMIAVFYVDWCTYCKKFMARLDKVRNITKDEFNVVLINVENPENEKLVREYQISGYPTVYIIDSKFDYRSHIDNPALESVDSFNKEVQRYANLRKLIKKSELCK